MGQAFDREGGVLGESWGPTKTDVARDLDSRFPDAERLEIRKVRERMMGDQLNKPSQDQCSTQAGSPDSPRQHAENTQRRLVIAREEHEKARTHAQAGAALVQRTAMMLEEAAREHESAVRLYLQTVGLTEIR